MRRATQTRLDRPHPTLHERRSGLSRVRAEGFTPEEHMRLLVGRDFWRAEHLIRGDHELVRQLTLTDGPHGVRKQPDEGDHLGIGDSIPATCFPPATTLGSSWDDDLVERVGAALGKEARALGVDVLLGPGINIKRSPLRGRNFEHVSEDPVVAGEFGAAIIRGIQQAGVAASVKHFAVNNQGTMLPASRWAEIPLPG